MTDNLRETIKSLTPEQKKAMAMLIKKKQAKMQEEPLHKHRFNNYAQERFRNLTSRYRNHKAANKVGKTDELGFELVAMCKGKCEEFGINFPHKPPLKIWYCGRDRNVLSDEPLASIKRYLKGEGIDHKTVYAGQLINMMYIWDDHGNTSEIRFKPYNGEIGIFESANVHAVFMDEEPPRCLASRTPAIASLLKRGNSCSISARTVWATPVCTYIFCTTLVDSPGCISFGSIYPFCAGTNVSGPASPTRYAPPIATGPPLALGVRPVSCPNAAPATGFINPMEAIIPCSIAVRNINTVMSFRILLNTFFRASPKFCPSTIALAN